MVEVSFLASFMGGLLSLLSPCSALLLPAFFAYAFQSRFELAWRTAVFYAGLTATLVPLGMGLAAVSRLVYGYRGTLILVSGLLIIGLGILQISGRGFSFVPARLGGVRGDSPLSTFVLGAVYGFAGFCSGPILGAVLTVAASSGSPLYGAGLLAIYAAGMAAPLFAMALLWDRLDLGHRRWLRGREITLPGGVSVHSTNLVSGVMFILLGTVFIVFQGTSALEGFYAANGATDLAFAAERWVNGLAESAPIALMLAVLAVVFAGFALYKLARRLPRRGKKRPADHGG
ncbi:MAG: Cytochrome c-type biogenesis protein CcdA (DsbD analog) [uncultured Rubrobacteraceae bacterium]|uniref:Cytochrome c-type biogenesis protein CcdA (DsbD analog) n=1 Tax=uncultured Rubrobacteraceae bacterium TaxID=349277 RepID=A0A6J4NHC5_9ACTN|nr:MAG: Cytochrome c-type biogenesis protein CcdA (DsbD analog) [uncultured Rubrobacteraceae bacterium]